MLRIMQSTIEDYLARLRAIKRAAGQIQAQLNRTLDNRALVQMFDLTEDLIYYVDAIEANQVVLNRVAAAGERLGLTAYDLDLLEDMRIDNAKGEQTRAHLHDGPGRSPRCTRKHRQQQHERPDQEPNRRERRLPPVGSHRRDRWNVRVHLHGRRLWGGLAARLPPLPVGMVLLGFGLWKVIGIWIDRQMGGQGRLPADRYLPPDRMQG